MSVTIPDLLTVQQANGRYIVRKSLPAAGLDDADLITIDTSDIVNVDGVTIKEALESIDVRLAALAGSLSAGDYPIVKNWKPRAFRIPATNPARRVETNDNPDLHIYESLVFDADIVDHVAILGADLPLGFTPGNMSLDLIFHATQGGLASSDTTDLKLAFLDIADTDPVNPSYGADQTVSLVYPGGALFRSTVSIMLTSPMFGVGNTLSFRLRVLGSDPNDFGVHITGAILRRL